MAAQPRGGAAAPAPQPPPPAVLCLAGAASTRHIVAAAANARATCVRTRTLAEAAAAWAPQRFDAVVAALGQSADDRIFTNKWELRGVAAAAGASGGSTSLIVYSHTACGRPEVAERCRAAGAAAVVCTAADLTAALRREVPRCAAVPPAAAAAPQERALPPYQTSPVPKLKLRKRPPPLKEVGPEKVGLPSWVAEAEATTSYGPVQRGCKQARAAITAANRGEHPVGRAFQLLAILRQLVQLLEAFPGGDVVVPLRPGAEKPKSGEQAVEDGGGDAADAADAAAPAPVGRKAVRVVHISDTHNKHHKMALPPGDLLLHSGDIVANYDFREDLTVHLQSFVTWVAEAAARYEHVVFIAGNHDTLLDDQIYPAATVVKAKNMLGDLCATHSNVHFLENSSVTVCGLTIWGSPVVPCRYELFGKRFLSSGFERAADERRKVWQGIPDGVDILMTHCPPDGVLGPADETDSVLRAALDGKSLGARPRLHLVGHCHGGFGVARTVDKDGHITVSMNAAQDLLLRTDRAGLALECLVEL